MRTIKVVGRIGLALAAVMLFTVPARTLLAHEGHRHKALGTVAAIDEKEDGENLAREVLLPAKGDEGGEHSH